LIRPLGVRKATTIIGFVLIVLMLFAGYYFLPKNANASPGVGRSLMILPFDNFTGSDELDYFVSGMHSSLIGDVGKISALRVISKTTSNAYKAEEKSIPEIATELNLDAVVETSILCIGDTVCVQIKLVGAYPEEQQLWSQDYYVEKSQILNLYSWVTKQISDEINVLLTPQEERMLAESRIVDTAAYDLYLKGQFYLDQFDTTALRKAARYFNLAIGKDPDWAPPYAGLAHVVGYEMQMGYIEPSMAIPKKMEYVNKALGLDSNSAEVHYLKAGTAVWTKWNWEEGEKEFLKAIELNPSHSLSRIFYAHLLLILRRGDEALYHAKIAQELDPLRPFILGLYAVVLQRTGDCQAALMQAEKAVEIEPGHRFAYRRVGEASYCLGDYERAFEIWKSYAWWDEEVVARIEEVFHEGGYFAAIDEIIKVNEEVFESGGRISATGQSKRHMILKQYERAIDWLEKAYDRHDPNLPYFSASREYNLLKEYPRYIELLKKMGLPYQ
jgi:TolB-like protein/tetratricopeptide (TPR) repeat protein